MYPSRFRYEAPRSLDEAIAPAARRRRRGQGARRRPEPGAAAEAALRLARAAGRHQRPARPRLPPGRRRRHASASARCAGTPTWSARRCSPATQPTMAAAAPLVADPIVRNRGTLVGSLCHADPQGDWASVVTALGGHVVAQGPRGRRTIPVAEFVTGPFQNVLAYDEIAVEAVIPAPKGDAGRRLPQAGAPRRRLRHRGSRRRARALGRRDHPGRHRAHRRRRLDDRRRRRGAGPGRRPADAPTRSAQAADLAAQAAQPRTDHRGSAELQAAHRAHLRRAHPDPRRRRRRRGRPEMTSLFEEISRRAGRRRAGPAGHASRSTASGAPPTSSRGCCWPTCCARASS